MIILTGGAGFIGSCFLWKLNSEGIKDILVVDHFGSGEKWKNLSCKNYYNYMEKNDFLNAVIKKQILKPDIVIHLGACSSTTFSDASYYIKNNYEYSKILALWAFECGAYFMYASSAATYGDGKFGFGDDLETTKKLSPLNIYGFTKHMFDLWLINNNYIDKVIGLKFFNVFGPNEYHKGNMRSVICKSFYDILKNGSIKLFKSYNLNYFNGEQCRDFIYIKDVVNAMYFFFKNPLKRGIFNLGTGKPKTWNDIAKSIFMILGKKEKIKYIDMPDYVKIKYQYFTKANILNLRDNGYNEQFMELRDSIEDYYFYLRNGFFL
ncbi:MAG: ADP-glyceromanno-heptose 6-epimerase [Endomicrobium sp.]|jgi:ADP-L-glycero-D-manno-heptose 6-epimerase|nr:ADP-glyceromanno-heptose 6-epimerase [Endomicrobium sp.]